MGHGDAPCDPILSQPISNHLRSPHAKRPPPRGCVQVHLEVTTGEELQELERTARRVATLMPEILLTDPKRPRHRLKLPNQQKRKSTDVRSH